MASRKPPSVGQPMLSKADAILVVQEQIRKGEMLLQGTVTGEAQRRWTIVTEQILSEALGLGHAFISEVIQAQSSAPLHVNMTQNEKDIFNKAELQVKVEMLKEALGVINRRPGS